MGLERRFLKYSEIQGEIEIEREIGKLEKLQPGMYMGRGFTPLHTNGKEISGITRNIAWINHLTLY